MLIYKLTMSTSTLINVGRGVKKKSIHMSLVSTYTQIVNYKIITTTLVQMTRNSFMHIILIKNIRKCKAYNFEITYYYIFYFKYL